MRHRIRNTGTRGYSGYRGRIGSPKTWLVVLLALVILAGAAFLFVQRYRVYRADGSSYLELPWARRAAEEAPPPQVTLTVEQPPAEAEGGG